MRTKAYEQAELSINREKRECLALISTNDVDRDQEIVLPEGLRVKGVSYAGRPVLWQHDRDLPAIGTLLWVKPQGNGILAKFRLARTEKANEIYELIQDDVLSAVSIGFEVYSERPISPIDLQQRPEWAGATTIIDAYELLELSICNIPCNANAHIIEKSMEVDCWEYETKTAPAIPKPTYARKSDLDAVIQRVLRRHDANDIIDRIRGKA